MCVLVMCVLSLVLMCVRVCILCMIVKQERARRTTERKAAKEERQASQAEPKSVMEENRKVS